MKNYNCEYEDGIEMAIENWQLKIKASSPEKAYEKFISTVGIYDSDVLVETSFFKSERFDWHRTGILEEKRRIEEEKLRHEAIINAKKANEILIKKANDGYFKLDTQEKIKAQIYFESLVNVSAERKLYDEEIQYLKLWLNFKDRELGQSLLAQSESGKPKEERGKTKLLQTISTGIVAGNMAKAHQLRELKELNESVDEIAEDVEDHSGGFEG